MTELDGIVERYNEMKQELEDLHLANLSERDVANIVQEFKNEINSVRVMSHIRDLRGVMLILEARRILQPENPWALEKISQIVDRPFGLERIKHYNRYLQAKILLNQNSPPKPDGETNCKLKLVDEVFEEISQHLISDWRMFARSLELKENDICLIENSNEAKEKAPRQVLEKFRDKNPTADHISLVIAALKSINRFQLVRNIQTILTSNSCP